MKKRSFAWNENPYSGMLRFSLLQTNLPKRETGGTEVPQVRNGPRISTRAQRDRVIVVFDNSACEPDSHRLAHETFAGLFSATRETIWPMMTDRIHDTAGTPCDAYRPFAHEGHVLSRRRPWNALNSADGGKVHSDFYMGHGS